MKPHEETWTLDEVIVMHHREDGQKEAREVLGHAAPDMARALLGFLGKKGHAPFCHAWFGGGGDCIEPCRGMRLALERAGVPLP